MQKAKCKNEAQAKVMATRGFIPLKRAAQLVRLSCAAVTKWLDSDPPKVESIRVGKYRYVRVSSLVAHLGPAAAAALGIDRKAALPETKTTPTDQ